MPVVTRPKLAKGFTKASVTIIDVNAIASRRTVPADDGFPAITILNYTVPDGVWNWETGNGTGWRHIGVVTGGKLISGNFTASEPEPRHRLVEVPA